MTKVEFMLEMWFLNVHMKGLIKPSYCIILQPLPKIATIDYFGPLATEYACRKFLIFGRKANEKLFNILIFSDITPVANSPLCQRLPIATLNRFHNCLKHK
jgi:hypothetical protein